MAAALPARLHAWATQTHCRSCAFQLRSASMPPSCRAHGRAAISALRSARRSCRIGPSRQCHTGTLHALHVHVAKGMNALGTLTNRMSMCLSSRLLQVFSRKARPSWLPTQGRRHDDQDDQGPRWQRRGKASATQSRSIQAPTQPTKHRLPPLLRARGPAHRHRPQRDQKRHCMEGVLHLYAATAHKCMQCPGRDCV